MGRRATPRQRIQAVARQDGLCAICRAALPETFELDHIQPFRRNGPTRIWNLQAVCVPCHRQKTRQETPARGQELDLFSREELFDLIAAKRDAIRADHRRLMRMVDYCRRRFGDAPTVSAWQRLPPEDLVFSDDDAE